VAAVKDGCRFCKLYATALVAIAGFLGALQAVQFSVGLREFGGLDHVWRVVMLSAARSHAPAANGSALLLAFLLWSNRLPPPTLLLELPSKLKRGMLLSLLGYPAALLLLVLTSLPVATLFFGAPLSAFSSALSSLGPGDFAVGYVSTLVDALVIVLVSWRALPALHRSRLSLPAKIGVAWAVLFVIRSLVGLALPGGPRP
jgi:hypothetical protein